MAKLYLVVGIRAYLDVLLEIYPESMGITFNISQ